MQELTSSMVAIGFDLLEVRGRQLFAGPVVGYVPVVAVMDVEAATLGWSTGSTEWFEARQLSPRYLMLGILA